MAMASLARVGLAGCRLCVSPVRPEAGEGQPGYRSLAPVSPFDVASTHVRQSHDEPELDARVKQGRKRIFSSSPDATLEVEGRKRTKPERRAARVRRVVVEAAPPPTTPGGAREDGQAGGAGGFKVMDENAYEGWRQMATLIMPPDVDDDVCVDIVME
jgi:hypothetical protein